MMKMAMNSFENVLSEFGIGLQKVMDGVPLFVMDENKTHQLLK